MLAGTSISIAEDKTEFVPTPGKFPPANAGTYLAGELVAIDHVNRRGALRLDGDFMEDRYHSAPSQRFALLPYGMVRYHNAPAELVDIPLGTHLHGMFVLPPADDNALPPVKPGERYVDPHNHALWLEDDVSFYTRRGQSWRIVSLEREKEYRPGKLKVVAEDGPEKSKEGLTGEVVFEIDRSTRIWKGRSAGELEDLAPGQIIQLNLTWSPEWTNLTFHCGDIWLDDEARALATKRQLQKHLRYQHYHWLAGWVEQVEHQAGAKGIVTITLFGGMDPAIYDDVRKRKKMGFRVAAAENTLRTWWHHHDAKWAEPVELIEQPDPPAGSSGLQLRLQLNELLEGYRPGRVVRVAPSDWPNDKLPPEERIKSFDELIVVPASPTAKK